MFLCLLRGEREGAGGKKTGGAYSPAADWDYEAWMHKLEKIS